MLYPIARYIQLLGLILTLIVEVFRVVTFLLHLLRDCLQQQEQRTGQTERGHYLSVNSMELCKKANPTFSFQNTSVLENHHWRSAVGCLLESGVSEQLPDRVKPELQRHISSLILATDITRQQEFLTRFKVHHHRANVFPRFVHLKCKRSRVT
jgi:hypothetical protein